MSNDHRADSMTSGVRQRPPRVLSEEQKLMMELRAKVDAPSNKHSLADRNLINEVRKKNGDTFDLMVAFNKVVPNYNFYTIQKVYEALVKGGVEQPSTLIDNDSVQITLDLFGRPEGLNYGWETYFHEPTVSLVTYVLLSGEHKHALAKIVKERRIEDAESAKAIIEELKGKPSSLSSGVL